MHAKDVLKRYLKKEGDWTTSIAKDGQSGKVVIVPDVKYVVKFSRIRSEIKDFLRVVKLLGLKDACGFEVILPEYIYPVTAEIFRSNYCNVQIIPYVKPADDFCEIVQDALAERVSALQVILNFGAALGAFQCCYYDATSNTTIAHFDLNCSNIIMKSNCEFALVDILEMKDKCSLAIDPLHFLGMCVGFVGWDERDRSSIDRLIKVIRYFYAGYLTHLNSDIRQHLKDLYVGNKAINGALQQSKRNIGLRHIYGSSCEAVNSVVQKLIGMLDPNEHPAKSCASPDKKQES